MLLFYLACLVTGGAIIIFSFFTAKSGESVSTPSGLTDVSNIKNNIDQSSVETKSTHTLISYTMSEIGKFFSFMNFIYFIMFFGFTGSILTLLRGGALLTSIFSSATGLLGWWLGYRFLNNFRKTGNSEVFHSQDLKGKIATVIIPVNKSRKGKVIAILKGKPVEITAALSDNSHLEELNLHTVVKITEVKKNYVYVVETDMETR